MKSKRYIKKGKFMAKEKLEAGMRGSWQGVITAVLYLGQNNYSVVKLNIPNIGDITAEGKIPAPQKRALVKVTGEVVFNEKYNNLQIKVSSSDIKADPEQLAAVSFIYSDAIPGFTTVKTASAFVEHFGTDLGSYMTDVDKLMSYPRITLKRAEKIAEAYAKNANLYPLFQLTAGSMTAAQANKIYEKYGENSVDMVKSNPYRLIYDVDRVGFSTADSIALKIGFKYDSKERVFAALVHCVKEAETNEGHTYIPIKMLFERAAELIFSSKELKSVYYQDVFGTSGIPDDTSEWDNTNLKAILKDHPKQMENIINHWDDETYKDKTCKKERLTSAEVDCLDYFCAKRRTLIEHFDNILMENSFDARKLTSKETIEQLNLSANKDKLLVIQYGRFNEMAAYSRTLYIKENRIAEILCSNFKKGSIRRVDARAIDAAINKIQKEESAKLGFDYKLDPDQVEAVKMAVTNRVSVITGGPGRGKTTIIKTAIYAWENSFGAGKPEVVLLAPTGKAAKRMTESTGYKAQTIHRYLGPNFVLTNDNTIIFVDESSMMDLELAERLIRMTTRAQIVFVGDVDQLPSVGSGTVLEDLIESKAIPFTYLVSCHRNSGSILDNSVVINRGGRLQELTIDNHFKTLWLEDSKTILDKICSVYQHNLPRYGAENMIALTAMRERGVCVKELNKRLQEIANPAAPNKNECQIGNITITTLREGDRVMQTKNDYNVECSKDGKDIKGVFNGETGKITKIETSPDGENTVTVLFDDGKEAIYPHSCVSELTLSYALTYHKSQGSEYKFVICSLTTADYMLLQRKILYTGESRAKEFCVFIGQAKAFQMAINDTSGGTALRYTMLRKRLQEYK